MPKYVICSDNLKSRALKSLATALSTKLGYKVYRVKPDRVRNRKPIRFEKGIDKVAQLQSYHRAGVSAPDFCTTLEKVIDLPTKQVVVRSLTNSSEGRGITICNKDECNIRAPLYTGYIPKKKEFRVHVWNNKVFDVQEKRKRKDRDQTETQVRNTANGYVFCRDNVNPPADCTDTALAAVKALGRSYGAVDIIWNEKRNKCYVLEVNSRPGMQGTTLEKYTAAILGT